MIRSYGPPDNTTPGNVGDLYYDLDTDKIYRCKEVAKPSDEYHGFITVSDSTLCDEYVWEEEKVIPAVVLDPTQTRFSLPAIIQELVIPEGITSIPEMHIEDEDVYTPFYGYQQLRKVTIPSTFDNGKIPIGWMEFVNYAITGVSNESKLWRIEVVLSEGITEIGNYAFNSLCVGKIHFPESLKVIGAYILPTGWSDSNWDEYPMRDITIPSGVTTIDPQAFAGPGDNVVKTITVNKPENSIPGAPWGATNATVIWTG